MGIYDNVSLDNCSIIDIECDSVDATKIWCVVIRKGDDVKVWKSETGDPNAPDNMLLKFLDENLSDIVVGHNIIDFDIPVIKRMSDVFDMFDHKTIIDTLVVSRMLNFRINGGHSLNAWGKRLGFHKQEFSDFDEYSDKMVEYCINDTLVTYKLFERFLPYIKKFDKAVWLECESAKFCRMLHDNGFAIDVPYITKLSNEIEDKLMELLRKIRKDFPPYSKLIRTFKPRVKKDGKISSIGFSKLGDPEYEFVQGNTTIYDLNDVRKNVNVKVYKIEQFNPESTVHVIDALWKFGWKPVEKTKGHKNANLSELPKEKRERFKRYGWVLNDENLSTLPDTAPESAKYLKDYLTLSSRLSLLSSWRDLIDKNTSRIHGRFLHIGTWTHRMAHQNPNMGNVPSRGLYGSEFRSCWIAEKGNLLVGTDASGIQMRIFAHYANDKKLIDIIVSGEDIHSLHAEYLGGVERDKAKTFIYAFLFGAGPGKVAEILECSREEAEERIKMFLSNYPNLEELQNKQAPLIASRGWFEALDGRYIVCNQPRLVLAGLCQSGEAIVMKLAACKWMKELDNRCIDYKFVNFVHDEFQTEVKDDEDIAHEVGKIQVEAIKWAGERLGVVCPLDGEYIIGKNWHETH